MWQAQAVQLDSCHCKQCGFRQAWCDFELCLGVYAWVPMRCGWRSMLAQRTQSSIGAIVPMRFHLSLSSSDDHSTPGCRCQAHANVSPHPFERICNPQAAFIRQARARAPACHQQHGQHHSQTYQPQQHHHHHRRPLHHRHHGWHRRSGAHRPLH